MCRKFFFLSLFLLLLNQIHAQKFDAGILAGLSTSQVDGDDLSGFNKAGIKAGGFVSRKLGGKAALTFGIEYIQKGSRKPVNADNEYFLMRLSYIEVPLMFNYYVGKKWNLEAGFALATLLSSYEEDQTGEILHAPEFNRFDYLVAVGGNYFITDHLFFNIRYSYSIVPMRGKIEGYEYRYFIGGQYNKVLAFALAYVF